MMSGKQLKLSSFFGQGSDSTAAEEETEVGGGRLESTEASSQGSCNCQGCSQGIPYQPTEVPSSKTIGGSCRQSGRYQSYSRQIQPNWYQNHPWITVCISSSKIFCATCREANRKGLLTFPKNIKSTFVEDGFSNWKKATQRFNEHEKSMLHKESLMKLASLSSMTNIAAQLSSQREGDQKFHRKMLLRLLSCIKFLGRQGLALRGHDESISSLGGNLYQLLVLQAEDSESKVWLQKREYLSPEIINELIMIMGHTILRQILVDIRNSKWFSIISDEATDTARCEQLCVSVRWVDSHYDIHEDALGLVQLPETKALTIFQTIKDVLVRCSLPLELCRGQAYDGAANMAGIHSGVQALVKKEQSRALYVHCLAHSLNLSVQEVTKKCDLLRNIMDFMFQLIQLIKFSPKRLTLVDGLRKEMALNSNEAISPNLRTLCPTRWTVRHSSINSILKNYKILQTALEEIQTGHDEYAAKASGMLLKMDTFETFFSLKLAYLIYSAAEQFSINIQAKNITVQEALKGATLLIKHYKSLRTEEKFNSFFDSVLQESSSLTEEPTLPRHRKLPRRYDEGTSSNYQYTSPKERYRHFYFEALEFATGEVERRFDQPDFILINQVEELILQAANGEDIQTIPKNILEYIENDIDFTRLKIQLHMIPDMIKSTFPNVSISRVTSIRTVADAMEQSNIYKGMLGEVDKLLRIYFCFPVTSSTAERSFSLLRRIKTFLRSTMTQSRLNNLFMLYAYKDKTDELDLVTVAKQFVSVNSRRLNYFGKF